MLCKNISKSVLVIEKTENSSKNSFQDHQLNIDSKMSCRRLRSKSESFQDHSSTSFKTMAKSAKNEDSFKTNDQKTGKSVLSGPSIKSAKKDPNPLLSRPSSLKMYQNRVLSRPLRMDPKTTLLSRPWEIRTKNQLLSRPLKIELKTLTLDTWSLLMRQVKSFQILRQEGTTSHRTAMASGPPPPGSRFNPIYVEPGSVSINSTRDLQVLFPNSFDCIRDMKGKYDIKTDPTVPPVQHGRQKVPIEYKEEIEKELAEMVWQGIITKQTEPTPMGQQPDVPQKGKQQAEDMP